MITDDTNEAMEMLRKGYEHPSVQIEPAQTIIQRRNGRMEEIERAAFVKISTAFKEELGMISGDDLKVWLFISLSVNRFTGTANPGIRLIAQKCKLDKDTVSRATKRLEDMGLLTVDRDGKKRNIYEPMAFVSANKSVPTEGTDLESVPIEGESVPIEGESVPIERQKNAQPEEPYKPDTSGFSKKQQKKDLVDGLLELYRMPGAKKVIVKQYIESQIKIRMTLNPTGKDAETFINHAADCKIKEGQEIDRFIDYWLENYKDRQYWSFRKMLIEWPAAFSAPRQKEPEPQPTYTVPASWEKYYANSK